MKNIDLKEELKNSILALVGAAAISYEKASKLVEECIKKGTITVEQGKTINEELKHKVKENVKAGAEKAKEKIKKCVDIEVTEETIEKPSKESILKNMEDLSLEDLQEILKKAEELKNKNEKADDSGSDEQPNPAEPETKEESK